MIKHPVYNWSAEEIFVLILFKAVPLNHYCIIFSASSSTTFAGKIKDMFSGEEFGPLTRLVLVNAVYFKGDWKQKFRKEDTQVMNFTKKDGTAIKIPMMKALLRTKYGNMRNHTLKHDFGNCQVYLMFYFLCRRLFFWILHKLPGFGVTL